MVGHQRWAVFSAFPAAREIPVPPCGSANQPIPGIFYGKVVSS